MDGEVLVVLIVGGFITLLFTIAVAYYVKMTREV